MMLYFNIFPFIFGILTFRIASGAVLENLFNGASSCEKGCDTFFDNSPELQKSCAEGCRLYTIIGLARDDKDVNKTTMLCIAACSEAYKNESLDNACNYGCCATPPPDETVEEVTTIHLLTPLMYVKSAYNTMTRHVKQFISSSWTVYVQEDSGKMVLLQTSPKVVEGLEYSIGNNDDKDSKAYQSRWPDPSKVDWMDCLAHQAGVPRWVLVTITLGFIFTLLWLCCATAITAAPYYNLPALRKKKDPLGVLIVCEAAKQVQVPVQVKVPVTKPGEAPPVPVKVALK